jgi:hypothetical protein
MNIAGRVIEVPRRAKSRSPEGRAIPPDLYANDWEDRQPAVNQYGLFEVDQRNIAFFYFDHSACCAISVTLSASEIIISQAAKSMMKSIKRRYA